VQEHEAKKSLMEQGFTLIELLVVIAILGILAAVVVFSVNGITTRGKNSACQADASTIQTAIQSFDAQNGAWPASLQALHPGFLASDPTNGHGSISAGVETATGAGVSPSLAAGGQYTIATGDYSGYTCPAG
jgi:prepilin-type N-terminal cleavage/methylation domain-containing protein